MKILDGDTCSQVYTLSELGCVDSVSISFLDSCLQVGVASHLNLNMVHPKVSVLVAGKENTWGKMDFPLENLSSQVNLSLLPLQYIAITFDSSDDRSQGLSSRTPHATPPVPSCTPPPPVSPFTPSTLHLYTFSAHWTKEADPPASAALRLIGK